VQGMVEKVIAYAGRTLSQAERNYGITERECLALVFGVKHFDCYLRHSKFEAILHLSALKWPFSLKQPRGRLARWIVLLQSYTMEISYRSGKLHSNTDALSRGAYSVKENGVDRGTESTQAVNVSILRDNDKKSKQAKCCETLNQTTSISLREISKHQKSTQKYGQFIITFVMAKYLK
jgi:hypothetical protein